METKEVELSEAMTLVTMEVNCTCGYEGNQIVQFETRTPSRQLLEYSFGGYWQHKEWVIQGVITLNWACPNCGKGLVQQRGGLSYNQPELKDMQRRLWHNNHEVHKLHKCRGCGKPITENKERIKSGSKGKPTEYYHESCIKEKNGG